jgi:CBS-domain-containing membrane protein
MGAAKRQKEPSLFTMQERIVSLGVSVALGIIIMAATRNVIWGFVTFFVLTIAINVAILKRKGHKF